MDQPRTPLVRPFAGKAPRLDASVFLAETATVIGDVELGARSSVWYGAVLRGDVEPIRIGEESNLQDATIVHVTGGKHGTTVGSRVTVGHRVTLHGCTIGDLCLIGMGSIVLDGAVIESESILGAGSLVSPGTRIPPRVLALGAPARVRRDLTEAELAFLRASAAHYVEYARQYRGGV